MPLARSPAHAQAQAARARGSETANEHRRAKKIRAASADQLPDQPLDDLNGVVSWLTWLTRMTVTGVIDSATSRETGKIMCGSGSKPGV